MSTVDVAALREAAEKATPGPWDSAQSDARSIFGDGGEALVTDLSGTWRDYENAAYIAAADPTTILALIERLEVAEGAVERVRALVDEAETFEDHYGNEFGPLVFADDLRAALGGAR